MNVEQVNSKFIVSFVILFIKLKLYNLHGLFFISNLELWPELKLLKFVSFIFFLLQWHNLKIDFLQSEMFRSE